MRISDKIKELLLQRINPLRIKINDPQKCRLSFKLNWLDTSITISLYDSSAISNIKTRFLRCNITADQTEFQFFIHSLIWEGLDRPQCFQSFHPRNYFSSYSFVFWKGIMLDLGVLLLTQRTGWLSPCPNANLYRRNLKLASQKAYPYTIGNISRIEIRQILL